MAENESQTITIDGQTYQWADLSETARAKVLNMRFVDTEIMRARNQLVVLRAARQEFARQLQSELGSKPSGNGGAGSPSASA